MSGYAPDDPLPPSGTSGLPDDELDVAGAVTVTGGLLALVYGAVEQSLLSAIVGALLLEPAMIFLITLYLQNVLHLSPLQTGLVFGVPGQSRIPAAPGR